MSYSKIRVYYYGDGISLTSTNTRQNVEKKITLALPNRVKEYGDRNGYGGITVTYDLDHIILKVGCTELMNVDINGESSEYIRRITRYEWL